MIFNTGDGRTIDTDRDLGPEERHVLQKLFAWEALAESLDQFRAKKAEALERGWNGSGPVNPGTAFSAVVRVLEQRLRKRLGIS
ncbi:MAG: hypothetical protein JRF59_03600 [Deltaproteobacteria bacterium]|nr:hypothetical protein [Deltaproteobacteria bacterium]MBW1948016.1 hypothetical protein [Deltaproteobacteria bacterium]MBW2006949.1 hypothetical protein [Deltaproteobacteria bacterium]MBW2346913.1 hypothetical protein [Deltaproteobacteria bacterium]